MNWEKIAVMVPVAIFLSVSRLFARAAGDATATPEVSGFPTNVTLFKWAVCVIVLVGVIRIIKRMRDR